MGLQLHEECLSPKVSSVSGECCVKFRINDVSQNHKNQGFHVVVRPDVSKFPHLCEVYECQSTKIVVKSKSPEKLHSQGSSKKRRSTRRSKKRIHDEMEDENFNDCNGRNGHKKHKHNKSTKHRKRKKSKRRKVI